jgi:hypothetical protein
MNAIGEHQSPFQSRPTTPADLDMEQPETDGGQESENDGDSDRDAPGSSQEESQNY